MFLKAAAGDASGLGLQFEEAAEGLDVDAEAAGDAGLWGALGEEAADGVAVGGKAPRAGALRPAEGEAFGAAAGEGLAGALGDQVAFDFGGDAQGEGEDLAGDVVAQAGAAPSGGSARS